MLRRMLGVDSWLDVASLENVEEDHSFLFLKKNLTKIFFFFEFWKLEFFEGIENFEFFFEKFGNLEILKEFEKIWLMKFFFFESGLRITSPMPLVPRHFFKISFFFFFFFFFWKTYPLNENNFGWKLMQIVG